MKYYIIRQSLDLKIVGHYPQSVDAIHHCHVWNEPKFIEHHQLKPLDFEPIISNAILHKKAKPTDLISTPGIGFTRKLLVSGKLKSLIKSVNNNLRVQFFISPLYYNNHIFDDYWLLYADEENNNYLDFNKSEIFLMEGIFDEIEKLNVKTFEDFAFIRNDIMERGYPFNILIRKYIILDISPDFLVLNNVDGGIQYLVSESLKQEIENTGCTGIEFQPNYLSLNEWLHNEREKIYGKA